jgi:hypothetical protein
MYSPDSAITWAVYVNKVRDNTFEIVAMGRGDKGKSLSSVAGLTINELYGVTVERKTEKNINEDKQVNLTKEIHVKAAGKYTISGTVHYYVEGDTNVKKRNFQLTFKN